MPRGPGGIYTPTSGNPVVPGTIIESDWANPYVADVGQEISDSLSRSGKGGMLASLRGLDGTAALPTFSFTNEPSTGRYRAGPGQVVESVLGQPVVRYLSTGLEQWDSNIMDWVPLTPRDAAGTPFDPATSNLTSTTVQDAIEEVNDKTGGVLSADNVTYDDSGVYFPAATVQIAIDRLGTDIPGLANDIATNADAVQILQGEFDLLEPRVVTNEQNIGINTNNIALLDTRVTDNDTDIGNLLNDVASIQLEQTQQNSDILSNTNYIDSVWGVVQTNQTNIAGNTNDIGILETDVSSLEGRVTANDGDILSLYAETQANAGNIAANTAGIGSNTTDISSNDSRISGIEGLFNQPASRLSPAYGGTGTTTGVASGTGNNVLSGSPAISGGSWDNMTMNNGSAVGAFFNNCTASTPGNTVRNSDLATTLWVNNMLDHYNAVSFQSGSNSNGHWYYIESWLQNGPGTILQAGSQASGSRSIDFPVAFLTRVRSILLTPYWPSAPSTGTDDGLPTVVSTNGVNGFHMRSSYTFYWLAIGD